MWKACTVIWTLFCNKIINSSTFGLESKPWTRLQKAPYFPVAPYYEIPTVYSMFNYNKYQHLFISEVPFQLFTTTPDSLLLHVSRLRCFPYTHFIKSKLAHCWLLPFSLFLSNPVYPTIRKYWRKLCESYIIWVVLHMYLLLKALLLITKLRNPQGKLHISKFSKNKCATITAFG